MQQHAYGRYLIKSWPLGQLWQARAYIGDRQIGEKEVADDPEAALAQLKIRLDAREGEIADGRGGDGSPSSVEYLEALQRLHMSDGQRAMLRAHLEAPDHCITATELARAAGYQNYNAANLKYGELGQALAIEMNYNPPTREDGSVIWTAAIAGWDENADSDRLDRAMERRDDDGHFEWIMRPQVVQALRSLNF